MAGNGTARVPERLQQLLLDAGGLEDFLAAFAAFCADEHAGLGVHECAVTLERSRRPRLWTGSSGRADRMDEAGVGEEGPCSTVLDTGAEVLVRDLGSHRRYRAYGAAVAETGLRSAAALALVLEPGSRGALACYAEAPESFGTDSMGLLRRFTAAAAPSLRLALRLDAQLHRARNLQAALESRTVVDIAVGIIMGQNSCSQEAAVQILRNVSNSRNIKVREVAAGVVAGVSARVRTHFDE